MAQTPAHTFGAVRERVYDAFENQKGEWDMVTKLKLIFALLAFSACAAPEPSAETSATARDGHEIILVRHAEKLGGDDPSLSEAGIARADTLSEILSDAGLTHIHSTSYRRTLETAAPIAAQTGIEVRLYEASDLEGFADLLQATPGTHLVVGHSNTTPYLASLLGGDPGSEIDEASEYDRLYKIDLSENPPTSAIERYGVRYEKPDLAPTD